MLGEEANARPEQRRFTNREGHLLSLHSGKSTSERSHRFGGLRAATHCEERNSREKQRRHSTKERGNNECDTAIPDLCSTNSNEYLNLMKSCNELEGCGCTQCQHVAAGGHSCTRTTTTCCCHAPQQRHGFLNVPGASAWNQGTGTVTNAPNALGARRSCQ
jgi:hypothetical protein